jgi:hypothetical protein
MPQYKTAPMPQLLNDEQYNLNESFGLSLLR